MADPALTYKIIGDNVDKQGFLRKGKRKNRAQKYASKL